MASCEKENGFSQFPICNSRGETISTPQNTLPSQASTEEVEKILQEADAATAAEDWERVIALYRKLLSFDRVIQGAEAKLQWALRMREIDALYKQGQVHLKAQRYADALAVLRKARLMYASHYKDVDALIVQAQTALQKQNWETRPVTSQKKGCFLFGGAIALVASIALALAACASPTPAPAPTAAPVKSGDTAKLQPQQRTNMYKSAPALTIDVNKKYVT